MTLHQPTATSTATAEQSFASARRARRRLALNARHALLTAHIVLAVALLVFKPGRAFRRRAS